MYNIRLKAPQSNCRTLPTVVSIGLEVNIDTDIKTSGIVNMVVRSRTKSNLCADDTMFKMARIAKQAPAISLKVFLFFIITFSPKDQSLSLRTRHHLKCLVHEVLQLFPVRHKQYSLPVVLHWILPQDRHMQSHLLEVISQSLC